MKAELAEVSWEEGGTRRRALWISESSPLPRRVVLADDTTRANEAFRLAAEGTSLLYRGDYHNARQLLGAITRRVKDAKHTGDLARDFQLYRQRQGREAQIAGKLLVEVDENFVIPMRRAPDLSKALREAWISLPRPALVPLREVLGTVGAHEWRENGVDVPALGARVHPHFGVFAPIRGEYVELVAQAPLNNAKLAFDIGTGTGVLAAVLAKRGVPKIVATDSDLRSFQCANENITRLGFADRVEVRQLDVWPEGRADLIVCNPPWLPGRPTSRIERAIYDLDSGFLKRFVLELKDHLAPGGEGWLVMSDLAERLGLRPAAMLPELFETAGLVIRDTLRTTPRHKRANDREDVLHVARSQEQTALYRLAPR
ncbi:MAG: class I SAM-dependent methyltransferase [Deltaproteobacteria bacterium]|nr:class I SAM-dependent methyltransferase [Deltaproteobacteria bacterium]